MQSLFVNPAALWLLGLSGVILALYLLRLKRRRMEISSTLLWSQALEEFQANVPLKWLRKNLLMILQLLVLVLLVFALSRPFFIGRAYSGKRTVIAVDTSYSMLARDGGKTRLERAMERARGIIGALYPGDQALILAMNDRPKLLTGFTPDKGELAKAIRGLGDNMGGAADLGLALKLLGPLISTGSRIIVLSDGGFGDIGKMSLSPNLAFEYIPVGKDVPNAGITALNLSRRLTGDGFDVFVALSSTFKENIERTIKLTAGESLLDQRKVTIPAGGKIELVIGPIPATDIPLKLSMGGGDSFPEDDECPIVIAPKKKIPVILVSGPDILLESALANNTELDVSRLSPADAEKMDLSALNSVFIFNKAKPPHLLTQPFLAIAPDGETGSVYPGAETKAPRVIDWDAGNPMLEYVNVADLNIFSARQARLGSGAKVVIDGSAGPLLAAGETDGTGYVVMLFSPAESDLPLKPSFPILLHNIVLWLSKTSRGSDPYNAVVGKPWQFPVPPDVVKAEIVDPGGKISTVIPKGGKISGVSLDNIGLWTVKMGDKSAKVASNLVDERESRLDVKGAVKIGDKTIEPSKKARTSRELYSWLIALALLVFMGEWYLYHRRSI